MTSARRFGLVHLSLPLFAALPCVHTRMGDSASSFSLYAMFGTDQFQLSTRQSVPWMTFMLMIGIAASFAFRRVSPGEGRRRAITVTIIGLLAFLDQTLAVLHGYTQTTAFFLPPISIHAGVGLWCMLAAQGLALWLAFKLPEETNATDR